MRKATQSTTTENQKTPPAQSKAALRRAIQYGVLQARDEWIVGVLCDLELSPAARMVGAYLGSAIDLEGPCIDLSDIGGHLRVVATRLGLPLPIVAKSCNALVRRGWLRFWIGEGGHLRGFDISTGGRS
jgi:hypothetical protein